MIFIAQARTNNNINNNKNKISKRRKFQKVLTLGELFENVLKTSNIHRDGVMIEERPVRLYIYKRLPLKMLFYIIS